NYTGLVLAGTANQMGQTLLIMDYDFTMDTESAAYENIKNITTFTSNFITLEYVLFEKTYEVDVINVTPSRVNDKLILQTTDAIEYAEEVNLLITIRNR